jgi:CRP-like cAMP-binding protein
MKTSPSLEEIFATVPLLHRLSSRQRARLAHLAIRRSYRPGSIIVRQGDTSMALYIVLSGAVRIELEPDTGAPLPITELGPAGYFGEMGLIDDAPRSATVVALEPTECALLSKWDFRDELRHDPDIALALLPVLNERIRELEARLAQDHPAAPES